MSTPIPLLRSAHRRMHAPRRGLRREEAAEFFTLSPAKFDELVKEGKLPKPIRIGTRKIWDLRTLDLFFDNLSSDDGSNPFDEGAES